MKKNKIIKGLGIALGVDMYQTGYFTRTKIRTHMTTASSSSKFGDTIRKSLRTHMRGSK